MSEAEDIEDLAQLIASQALRIEALEADILDRESLLLAAGKRLAECDTAMVAANTLLKRFETALREIIGVEVIDPWSACGTMQIKARAALAPENGGVK